MPDEPAADGRKVRIGLKPGQFRTLEDLAASWEAAEQSGFDLLSGFDHFNGSPEGWPAWDMPSLLIAMAARTTTIRIGVHVLNTSLRQPFLLAAQLAAAQAVSGGRLEVGLGAGSRLTIRDNETIGIPLPPFSQRVAKLEACCRTFPRLWQGEQVTDDQLGLAGISLGPIGIVPPPIVLAGSSDSILELAARYADGWVTLEADPDACAQETRRLDDICRRVGRSRPLDKQVQLFVPSPSGERLPGTDYHDYRHYTDLESFRERLSRFEEAGISTVVFSTNATPDDIRRLAEAVV